MLIAILLLVGMAILTYVVGLARVAIAERVAPNIEAMGLGAVVSFFDTLGIGSFAPTMAWLKLRNLVPDRLIPCTMLVGHALPSLAQALIFLVLLGVLVDPVLLVGCIVALHAGALLGAPLVTKTRVWLVQSIVRGSVDPCGASLHVG